MKRLFISVALLMLTTPTFAQGLSQFSAAELLWEVGRRIDALGGGGGGGSNQLTLACDSHETSIQVITRNNVATKKYYNPNSTYCQNQVEKLRTKFPTSFTDFIVVQLCDNHELVTLRLTDNAEITEVNRTYTPNYNTCISKL